jgi:TatD DNase family protein
MNQPGLKQRAPLLDSHAHLTFRDFRKDLAAILDRAKEAGLIGIVTIGSGGGANAFDPAVELAAEHDWIWATVGLHPHDAQFMSTEIDEQLASAALREEVVAIGEAGLDYHYDNSPRDIQREVFRRQLQLAREVDKPIVVHTRSAEDETLAIVDEVGLGPAGGVVHCFSGGPAFAQAMLERGFHLSFSGIVSFPKADEVREAALLAPDDRIMIETDSPYLAPVPHRGRRNEPAYVARVAAVLAEARGVSEEDIARITTANTSRLFRLGVPSRVRDDNVVG